MLARRPVRRSLDEGGSLGEGGMFDFSLMHSYLITGGTTEERKKKEEELCKSWKSQQIDIFRIDTEGDKQSIGIAEVRKLSHLLMLSPRKSPVVVGIISQSELLTIEAQNALLKTLEEPPLKARVILETNHVSQLLPTILSRCQIIHLVSSPAIPEDVRKNILETVQSFSNKKPGEMCQLVDHMFKKKEDGLQFLVSVLPVLQEEVKTTVKQSDKIDKKSDKIIGLKNMINAVISAQNKLTAHVQFLLVLDSFFMGITRWTSAFS